MDVKDVTDQQIADIQALTNQFLATQSKEVEYWDFKTSEQDLAQWPMEKFLKWLRARGEVSEAL